jgi:putative transposase
LSRTFRRRRACTHGDVSPRYPQHLPAFPYTGLYRYFLTFCTDRRRPAFRDAGAVDLVFMQILRAATEEAFAIIAYCFMPDHLHLLIEARSEASDGRRFITRAKQFSGFYYSARFRERLWQRYGYERVLRSTEDTRAVARYILENPLRAGLVSEPAQYPFLGSCEYRLQDLLEWSG